MVCPPCQAAGNLLAESPDDPDTQVIVKTMHLQCYSLEPDPEVPGQFIRKAGCACQHKIPGLGETIHVVT
jgi:hypothetical protein